MNKENELYDDQNLFNIRSVYIRVIYTYMYLSNKYKHTESLLMIWQNRQDHLYKQILI